MKMMNLILKVRNFFHSSKVPIYGSLYIVGDYTLNHDVDSMDFEEDKVSMKSAASMKSVKSACDEEKKELQFKLMENYVNDNTKQKYKKTNSLKRIFSKKGKNKES